jgi:hypothetical protein
MVIMNIDEYRIEVPASVAEEFAIFFSERVSVLPEEEMQKIKLHNTSPVRSVTTLGSEIPTTEYALLLTLGATAIAAVSAVLKEWLKSRIVKLKITNRKTENSIEVEGPLAEKELKMIDDFFFKGRLDPD